MAGVRLPNTALAHLHTVRRGFVPGLLASASFMAAAPLHIGIMAGKPRPSLPPELFSCHAPAFATVGLCCDEKERMI